MKALKSKFGAALKHDFPFFEENPETAFLDSAASSLTPGAVIYAISDYYQKYSVNIHRGVYEASVKATEVYESTRDVVKAFVDAGTEDVVTYTSGVTQAMNAIAFSLEFTDNEFASLDKYHAWKGGFKKGDVIIISESEHHSNIVPWQIIAEKNNLEIIYIPIVKETGVLDLEKFEKIKADLAERTVKIISLSQASNVSGVLHDLTPFVSYAREKGAFFVIDGAQSVCHGKTSFQAIDADFLCFSAHKLMGPTGIGALIIKGEVAKKMRPFMGGGDMILSVEKEKTLFANMPMRLEAGTPNIGGVFGFKAAIEYVQNLGLEAIEQWERKLTIHALTELEKLGIHHYGPSLSDISVGKIKKVGVVSFGIPGIHPHDIGTILDQHKVAIRAGHHCCQILMKAWQVAATSRASFYAYTDKEDIDQLITALSEAKKLFK